MGASFRFFLKKNGKHYAQQCGFKPLKRLDFLRGKKYQGKSGRKKLWGVYPKWPPEEQVVFKSEIDRVQPSGALNLSQDI
jgi:hypothetical protein